MTPELAGVWRCRWCAGPLDAEGFHASERADCGIDRPGHPTMRDRIALFFDRFKP